MTKQERKSAALREQRRKNPEKHRAANRKWASENKDKVRAGRRAYWLKHPEKARLLARKAKQRWLQKKYAAPDPGTTCECCGEPFIRSPYCDHDHKTKTFRGWLCFHCNTALGHFRDSTAILQRAIDYLNRSRT